jgi:hypothetical protein
MGAEETQIEGSFCAAINTAKQQKAVSLEKRAEATYAEYRRQKASEAVRTRIPTTSLVAVYSALRFVQWTNEPTPAGRAQSREAAFGSRFGGTNAGFII